MANFDKSGDAELGNCDVSTLTSEMDKTTMISDAEYDALWEANKNRFYKHQAWPNLFGDAEKNPYVCTDEADAKVKLKQYLTDFRTGYLKDLVDCYFLRVYEGSDIRALLLLIACKFKEDTNPKTYEDSDAYLIREDADLKKLWEANGQSGDYRNDCIITDLSLNLPLSDGTTSSSWYYSWYVQNTTFEKIHRTIGLDGYKKILNQFSGTIQKNWIKSVFDMMKQYGDEGTIPRGSMAGQTVEAAPVFGYVDDNTTPAFTTVIRQNDPHYAALPDDIKPCGWPISSIKLGGKYPPYD